MKDTISSIIIASVACLTLFITVLTYYITHVQKRKNFFLKALGNFNKLITKLKSKEKMTYDIFSLVIGYFFTELLSSQVIIADGNGSVKKIKYFNKKIVVEESRTKKSVLVKICLIEMGKIIRNVLSSEYDNYDLESYANYLGDLTIEISNIINGFINMKYDLGKNQIKEQDSIKNAEEIEISNL